MWGENTRRRGGIPVRYEKKRKPGESENPRNQLLWGEAGIPQLLASLVGSFRGWSNFEHPRLQMALPSSHPKRNSRTTPSPPLISIPDLDSHPLSL